jgi:hypothetical protein
MRTPGPRDWSPRPSGPLRPTKRDWSDAVDEWEEIRMDWMELSSIIERLPNKFYRAKEEGPKGWNFTLDEGQEVAHNLGFLSRRVKALLEDLDRVIPPSIDLMKWFVEEKKREKK